MNPEAVNADIALVSSVLDPLIHEVCQQGTYSNTLIAAALGFQPESPALIVSTLTDVIERMGVSPARLGLQIGLLLGARLARANADGERLAS